MIAPRNILIIRLKSIGDVVFTLPATDRVRRAFPEARLVYLVSKECAPVVAGFPRVDDVIQLDRSAFRRLRVGTLGSAVIGLIRRLRRERFSLTIDFQGYGETALMTRLTGAQHRWGWFEKAWRSRAYTKAVPRRCDMHPADWYSFVLSECGLNGEPGNNAWRLPASGEPEAAAFSARHHLSPSKPLLFIQPGTSSPAKDWPLEKSLTVALHYRDRGCQVVFGGGPDDRERLAPAAAAGFPVSAGISLLGSAALAAKASVITGSDTGLLHLAVAMGKRVVMLIHDAGPGACTPLDHPEWALTPPKDSAVAAIPTEAVIEAIATALDQPK